ncbi:MAG: cache domain-containing protein [Pseudomonadota bacterium]|nr:cache domain-containing protein [Pseudomonadota bacterium]
MRNRKTLIQLLALGPVIFLPLVVFIVSTLIMNAEKETYNRALNQVSLDYLETEKSRIRSKVQNMVDLAAYRQSIIDKKLHNRIQRRVDDAQAIAIALYNHYSKKLPEAELKELIIESLRPLIWNGGESFIWILNFDGEFQLAPQYLRHLEGTSIIDFEDASGRKVIREEIAITKSQGQGFLWDTFTKPGEPIDKQFKQLAYVKNFGIYDWYLGSGEYLDTATNNTNTHLLEAINQVGKGGSDYFFVIDSTGTLLLNYARQDIVGKNMTESKNPFLNELYQSIVNATKVESNEFLSYDWINPQTGLVDSKLTYVQLIAGSNWIIGSGFYPNSLDNSYKLQEQRLTNEFNEKARHIRTLTLLGVLIALLISTFASIMFYRILSQYQRDLIEANDDLRDLNFELENKVLDRTKALEKVNQELQGLATTDSLTQISNRYALMNRLKEEIGRANRFNGDFVLIMFDIDFFKNVNDDYGHDVGDKVLQELSTLVFNEVRSVDLFGRLGGEEFLIIMPNTTVTAAHESAERIRQIIENHVFENELKITISLGVANYRMDQKISSLMKMVDLALYQAKKSGRNKTVFYDK